ncbi:hypothetical protein BGZ80_008413 [Entomortierella chlamydospora]|uniref:Uncharacterized protein n=1 Tax=Entomortierella chlamydospora TaxID=101097 RepID=A0A9P6MYQ5_9FUNG|nr:hypothetical protein BGZ80_008413 [Entomortierella chlamydospora]
MAMGTKGLARRKVIVKRLAAVDFNDPIGFAIRTAAEEQLGVLKDRVYKHKAPCFRVISFLPFKSSTRMTQATVMDLQAQESFKVIKGGSPGATCVRHGSLGNCELVGMVPLVDPPHPDSAETIRHCDEMDVDVKKLLISLGMSRVIMDAGHLVDAGKSDRGVTEHCIRAGGLAQVIPEHKYRIVKLLQNRDILAGITGDDVPGLSTIVDGLMTSHANAFLCPLLNHIKRSTF